MTKQYYVDENTKKWSKLISNDEEMKTQSARTR